MGTKGDGINIYDPNTDKVNSLYVDGLLKGKDVYGIIEGRNNNIWITTSDGLILYNVKASTQGGLLLRMEFKGICSIREPYLRTRKNIYI
jgi:ligand-binding sensor domain-containing protein